MLAQPPRHGTPENPLIRFAVVTVLTGIGAGLGGMALALLLHFIQHVAYGYSITHRVGLESFYEGVEAASAGRRVAVLALCGVIAGCGRFGIYRYGRPLVSIKKAVASDDPRMPPVTTTAHALLQIITVALGSLIAGWLSHYAGLTVEQTRLMVACGAGAGLAAVYNVPFGGAIFVLEVLLRSFELRVVIPALVTSVIAAVVAWLGLGDESQYVVPRFGLSANLVTWSIVTGPLFGVAAFVFVQLTTKARAAAPKGWTLPLFSLVNFVIIGLLAVSFPQILGNR